RSAGLRGADRQTCSVIGTPYAQVVAPSTTPGRNDVVRSSTARGSGVAMVIFGALIDLCAVTNVPGAATFLGPGAGTIEVTSLGTALVLVALAAWVSVIWRARHPLIVLTLGGVLALIGVSYLLFLV